MNRKAALLVGFAVVTSFLTGVAQARNGDPLTFVRGDSSFFTQGSIGVFNAPFNAKDNTGAALTRGKDYWNLVQVDRANFPNNVKFTWQYPAAVTGCGTGFTVCGYNSEQWADYDGTIQQAPVAAQQINTVSHLEVDFSATYGGTVAGFDVIWDGFLTTAKNSGQQDNEIEIFTHTPSFAAAFAASCTAIGTGTWADPGGRVWKTTHCGTDNLFVPNDGADITSGRLYVKDSVAYLVAQGRLTGNEWINGGGLGAEPKYGAGSLSLLTFSVTYN